MMAMFDVQGFILVGGESSRMGQDKARLRFGGRTSVELIATALQQVTPSVTTVGWTDQVSGALPNIPDLRPGWGPIAGIEAALLHSAARYASIVACDFPFVTGDLFERLLSFTEESDAIIPLQDDDRPQPLCAIYRVETCLPAVEEAIVAGGHSPRALLDRVHARYLPFSLISDLSGSSNFFFNLNTPENYEQAQRIFDEGGD